MVDDLRIGKVYWMYLKYSYNLNQDPPKKEQLIPLPPTRDFVVDYHTVLASIVNHNVQSSYNFL
jgi:hypothetical protein